jgi:hypothetical protein
MRKFLWTGLLASAGLSLAACAELTLSWARLDPAGPEAAPAALAEFEGDGPVDRLDGWAARAPTVLKALERHVYGAMPDASSTQVIERKMVAQSAFGGRGDIEEYLLAASATFAGQSVAAHTRDDERGFRMVVVTPRSARGSGAPVILIESFCPRWSVVPDPGVSRPSEAREMGGVLGAVATYAFGRYICTPPIEAILDAGFAIAVVAPSEIIPDRSNEGLAELRRLSAGYADDETRWGAIAAWAWVFSRMVDALQADPRFDRRAMIAWGHSRYGKSALLAAAADPRIAAVVAHQSGTGGASLNREKAGESIAAITNAYPHWFARIYARYAGRESELPVDQHLLLALIAPRPVLLGNARRDVWSDPNGAFRAAMGATPVYRLYNGTGLGARSLGEFRPSDDIAFWMRPGTHGVVKEDWPAFLEFLTAHFGQDGA